MAASPKIYGHIGDFVVREATPADFQAIIDIDDSLFDGNDYLPTLYYEFLQTKNCMLMVIEDKGKPFYLSIVGLDGDPPVTAALMGGRISPSRRGIGFARSLWPPLFELLLRHVPTLTKSLYVTQAKHLKSGLSTQLYRANILECHSTTSAINCRLAGYRTLPSVTKPTALTYSDVTALLTRGQELEEFFSRHSTDYIIAFWHWKPVKIWGKSDLRGMFGSASLILVTTENDTGFKLQRNMPAVGKITSLSCSFALPVKGGLACHIMFFGDDPSLAAQHEIEQVRHMMTVWSGGVSVTLMISDRLDMGPIMKTVNECIGKHRYLFEGVEVLGTSSFISQSKM